MELIELQCNGIPKAKYDTERPAQFIYSIPEVTPQLRQHVARTLCIFGSTYLCEKLFSVMQVDKRAQRSRLTDEQLGVHPENLHKTEPYTKPRRTCCQKKMAIMQLRKKTA